MESISRKIEFKRMYALGVNLSHDRAACLLGENGTLFAIAEERLDRKKHSCPIDPIGRLFTTVPALSIQYCLDSAGIGYEDIDVIVFCNAVVASPDDIRNLTVADCVLQLPFSAHSRMQTMNHHLAHAYSAYFPSGFEEAAVLVVDKGGSVSETYRSPDGRTYPLLERATIFHACDRGIIEVMKIQDRHAPLFWNSNSLGAVYEMATLITGNTPFDAGKTMGLAPYGSLEFLPAMRKHFALTDDGYQISPSIQTVGAHLFSDYYFRTFSEVNPDARNPSPVHAAVARAAQESVEEVMLHLARLALQRTGSRNLCIAGGLGLNCVANTRIRTELKIQNMFVQPASTDDGTAIGAALYGWQQLDGTLPKWPYGSTALGRTYDEEAVNSALREHTPQLTEYVVKKSVSLTSVARLIANGQVVGWFNGGSEFGPRALGHRSLLADPRAAGMRSYLNGKVKLREHYRPYGASVLLEKANRYFDLSTEEPFMLFVCDVRREFRDQLPNITHVDGTCRVQTVSRKVNPTYYSLIEEFEKLTGFPIILNTSLNGKSEPIVETPHEAIDLLLKLNLGAMYLDGFLVVKRNLIG